MKLTGKSFGITVINNRRLRILPMLVLVFALVGCTQDGKKAEQEITMPTEAASPASSAETEMAERQFEKIKSLVGDWYLTGGNQLGKELEPDPEVPFLTYGTSAAGNCVIEKLFAGQTKEMTTVYFLDNGQLSMHH